MDKQAELKQLAIKRQETRWPSYTCIGDYWDGAYECDFVSPYTRTAGNVDSKIFVMLHHWSSDSYLRLPFDPNAATLGHTPRLPTNRNLCRLLRDTFRMDLDEVYATNLFPFIKLGPIQGDIREEDLDRAAEAFALPQIRIVQPKLVICLGLPTFNALCRACGQRDAQRDLLRAALGNHFNCDKKIRIYCQAHTGQFLWKNGGGKDQVRNDWLKMKEYLDSAN